MNVKMIDDQKLSLVGNLSTSSTFLEIFKNLTAFFFKSLFKVVIRWIMGSFVGGWLLSVTTASAMAFGASTR